MNETTTPGAEDPRAMLALLQEQQSRVGKQMLKPVVWLYAIWGFAWLVGFLVLWSSGRGGNPWFSIPGAVAGTVFTVLIVGSIVASAVLGSRMGRGVRGASQFAGTVYGVSWSVCGVTFALLGIGLVSQGLGPDLAALYFPSAYALMCGTLYLAGSALWHDTGQLVIGLILLLVGGLAPFAGTPGNYLVMAVVGGGAFIGGSIVAAVKIRK